MGEPEPAPCNPILPTLLLPPLASPHQQAIAAGPPLQERLETVFERFLWRLRLIAILPVIMSLASTGVTFVLGTLEIGKAILGLSHAADAVEKGYMAKLLGAVATGIDVDLIGIALLIFGYGVYELLISPIDEGHQGNPRMQSGLSASQSCCWP